MKFVLTPDQQRALEEIEAARDPGSQHLLTGHAGSGKTTLMQEVAGSFQDQGLKVTMSAPTHKAASVLSQKLRDAGIKNVECRTIHSLLGLKGKVHADRMLFERDRRAEPVTADVVVMDECSMIGSDLLTHINRHLPLSFVLFVGDPAQLPPVGEQASETFKTEGRSHLDTIVRQAADNPILAAATLIRKSQGGPLDMDWAQSAKSSTMGVFSPRDINEWMRKAFTSPQFDADPDAFRYLAYTNARVGEVNRQVREWRYGKHIPTPFMPGERILARAPILIWGTQVLGTNEEAEVLSIERDTFHHAVPSRREADSWMATVAAWRLVVRKSDGQEVTIHSVDVVSDFNKVIARITDEARTLSNARWLDLHEFKSSMAKLQSIYALTVHTSQGSTFGSVFMDVRDIISRAKTNILETQQLFYVGATRARTALMLVGA